MDWTKMFNRKAEAVVQRDDAPNNCCHSVFNVAADGGETHKFLCNNLSA